MPTLSINWKHHQHAASESSRATNFSIVCFKTWASCLNFVAVAIIYLKGRWYIRGCP